MIDQALKYIAGLAVSGVKPELVPTGDPGKLTYLVGGDVVNVEKPVPPREHEAADLDTIAALASRWADVEPSLWVGDDAVVLLIDDQDGYRASTATMPLECSDIFARLKALAASKEWMEQKAFVRLLRIDLAGTLAPGVLLDRVRKLRFESGQVTTSEATKNRESMGRTITAAVSAEGELPEVVTLECRVFKGQERFSLSCSVDVDAARGLLQLAPLPDEIDRVSKIALAHIQGILAVSAPETVPVYLGCP